MIFQRDGCKPIENPSEKKLSLELERTKSSFAHLTANDGSYLQVAGGPGLFLLEYRNSEGVHFRSFQKSPVALHSNGTLLQTSAGSIPMEQNEWFLMPQVLEAFVEFMHSGNLPASFRWKRVNV